MRRKLAQVTISLNQMKSEFKNKSSIGDGVFTISDLSRILKIHKGKARRWLKQYWDGQLGFENERYSWKADGSIAVNFFVLIEFYVYYQLSEQGVKPKEMIKGHRKLQEIFGTRYPFTNKKVLEGLHTDKKNLYLKYKGDDILILDGTNQLKFNFLKVYLNRLEFDDDVVSRFYPLGKDHAVIVDPNRKFGRPLLKNKNIDPEVIYGHHKAGDPNEYIARVYELSKKEISDAIAFCAAA